MCTSAFLQDIVSKSSGNKKFTLGGEHSGGISSSSSHSSLLSVSRSGGTSSEESSVDLTCRIYDLLEWLHWCIIKW